MTTGAKDAAPRALRPLQELAEALRPVHERTMKAVAGEFGAKAAGDLAALLFGMEPPVAASRLGEVIARLEQDVRLLRKAQAAVGAAAQPDLGPPTQHRVYRDGQPTLVFDGWELHTALVDPGRTGPRYQSDAVRVHLTVTGKWVVQLGVDEPGYSVSGRVHRWHVHVLGDPALLAEVVLQRGGRAFWIRSVAFGLEYAAARDPRLAPAALALRAAAPEEERI
jgi:hypothetical protein